MTYTKHTKGIIFSYIIAQLGSLIIYPILLLLFQNQNDFLLASISMTISFLLGFILTFWFIRDERDQLLQTTFSHSLNYAMVGFMVAIFGQMVLSLLISFFIDSGVDTETEQYILEMSEISLLYLVIPVLIGPILEELVFRYALLGSFLKRMKTSYAVILSSLLFGILHGSLTNLVIYVFCGIVFSVIYIKTRSILTSIMAHSFMNGFVMVMLFIGL